MKIGYIRVSSADQNLDRQRELMSAEGVELVYEEKLSGKDNQRPELEKMLNAVRADDVVIIKSLDRIARSYQGFSEIWETIEKKGGRLKICDMGLTLDRQPITKFYVGIMAQAAELERGMIRERQREGIKLAAERGAYTGRKADLDMHQKVITLLRAGITQLQVSKMLGVNRGTVIKVKKTYQQPDGTYRDAK
ncbi:recombinase family protein [Klebsiella aerogenes]|uniref:recombinase family protein n=1 Tax=Klebsiella aerogenes TaxID=548 RepID=UPI00190F07EF|nr:recombinase family protein [Klebsiella aerogenes]MBK0633385.1 recombinase family protein [Klebsiella aerogenes]